MERIKLFGVKLIKYWKWIAGAVLLILCVLFIFRKVNIHFSDDKAVIEHITKERDEAKKEIQSREKEYKHEKDSLLNQLYYESNKIKERIKIRDRFVNRYIDTASVSTKFRYIDSLLGK
jgi:uncharacterized protein YpmS